MSGWASGPRFGRGPVRQCIAYIHPKAPHRLPPNRVERAHPIQHPPSPPTKVLLLDKLQLPLPLTLLQCREGGGTAQGGWHASASSARHLLLLLLEAAANCPQLQTANCLWAITQACDPPQRQPPAPAPTTPHLLGFLVLLVPPVPPAAPVVPPIIPAPAAVAAAQASS